MNEDNDPVLQEIFRNAEAELTGEQFTRQVLKRARQHRLRISVLIGIVAVVALGVTWLFSIPVLTLGGDISQALMIELVPLEGSRVGWLLAPLNNSAALLVLLWRFLRYIQRRSLSASYLN